MISKHPGRNPRQRFFNFFAALLLLSAPCVGASAQTSDWPQWGGPDRNFVSGAKGLAAVWPEGGPRKVWARELGEGYAVFVRRGRRALHHLRRGRQPHARHADARRAQDSLQSRAAGE